jgi:hypothetical protein
MVATSVEALKNSTLFVWLVPLDPLPADHQKPMYFNG